MTASRGMLFGRICLAGMIALAFVLCGDVAARTQEFTAFDLEGVTLQLPKGVTTKKTDRADFVLYYFTRKDHQILFAYVGGHPSFPLNAPKDTREQKGKVNGMTTRTVLWRGPKGGSNRETLVATGREDFARYVHFVYSELTDAEVKEVDAMIASAKVTPPKPRAPEPAAKP